MKVRLGYRFVGDSEYSLLLWCLEVAGVNMKRACTQVGKSRRMVDLEKKVFCKGRLSI